ncbi:hypothetical protein [Streptomyces sp. NPDC047886]|uniref:hypothetical protein n=1 Tax=Streptomyces sp. NPDC047886 TaxID=3365490 RepID=UPI00371A5B8E
MSAWAGDSNGYDPDKHRIFLETRRWPSSVSLTDFRLSVTAVDQGVPGSAAVTPWASQGGGRTTWAVDSNSHDFDGIVVGLEVQ